jgi:hypothetical protein
MKSPEMTNRTSNTSKAEQGTTRWKVLMKEEPDMWHKSALCLAITVLKLALLESGSSSVKRAKLQKIDRNIKI